MRTFIIIFLFFVTTAFSGCGRNMSLSGKVAFEDGTPLSSGTVVFDSGQHIARGEIQRDGTYIVGFDTPDNGIPKGEYRVYVHAEQTKIVGTYKNGEGEVGEEIEQVSLIAEKYASPETSGLTFTADGKTKTFDITVEKPNSE